MMVSNKFAKGKNTQHSPAVCKKGPFPPFDCPRTMPHRFYVDFSAFITSFQFGAGQVAMQQIIEPIAPRQFTNNSTAPAAPYDPSKTLHLITDFLLSYPSCTYTLHLAWNIVGDGGSFNGFTQNGIYKLGSPIYYDTSVVQVFPPVNYGRAILHTNAPGQEHT